MQRITMAAIPFSFECDWQSGFVMDPNEQKRVGYLTDFEGLGLSAPLVKDLTISLPYKNPAPAYVPIVSDKSFDPVHNTLKVIAVLEKFEWNGGVGDPLSISGWVSQENAFQIKALQQTTLKNTGITAFGFWIADYDQETKKWFEQAYPQNPEKPSGIVKSLEVDLSPVPVKDGIDVNVYKVSFAITPPANQTTALLLANSSTARVVKQWGLVISTMAKEG